jgi:hypothetical protein
MASDKHPLNLSPQTPVSHRLHSIHVQSVISVHSYLADSKKSQSNTSAVAGAVASPVSTGTLHSPTPTMESEVTSHGQATTATHPHQAVKRTCDTSPVSDDCTMAASKKPKTTLSGGMLNNDQSSSGTWPPTRNENTPFCIRCELWGPAGHSHPRDPSPEPVDCSEAVTMKPEDFLSKNMLNIYHPSSGMWTQRRKEDPAKDAPWCARCKVCETPHEEMSEG